MYAASGNCHVYVDASAVCEQAQEIVLNAKTQRPGVCNAAETVLVHSDIAPQLLPPLLRALAGAGVTLRGDERTRALAGTAASDGAPAGADGAHARADGISGTLVIEPASEEDWATEYLALTLAVRVVDSPEEAIEHIATYGSGHSEAIVTREVAAARAFQRGVDAACVYVNASTRFTDGGEFGMGAEIGNSTQKLHARGPIGLRARRRRWGSWGGVSTRRTSGISHSRAMPVISLPCSAFCSCRRTSRRSSPRRRTRGRSTGCACASCSCGTARGCARAPSSSGVAACRLRWIP